ncbi:unnamed protein product [Miscanthus lutarioriparius]|uniref:Uncharacterized protein n=1 Tax=Miscanthus lutarioriparius TaxID=422564 RepID=A0A811NSH2_9POAL|nr:unnamed protein product [Miscanthus lutarioriparius]
MAPGAEPVLQWSLAGARHDGARGGARAPMAAHRFFLDSSNAAPKRVFPAKGFLEARTEMAAATAGSAPAKEVVEKKVEFMKEIRAHEVAIAELGNLNPSRFTCFCVLCVRHYKFVGPETVTGTKFCDQCKGLDLYMTVCSQGFSPPGYDAFFVSRVY